MIIYHLSLFTYLSIILVGEASLSKYRSTYSEKDFTSIYFSFRHTFTLGINPAMSYTLLDINDIISSSKPFSILNFRKQG